MTLQAWHIDPARTRDLAPRLLDAAGAPRVVPAAALANTTPEERLRFGVEHGIYAFPTEELVAFLRDLIGGRSAIEIGAGHGRLAAALGIPATDNRQREGPASARTTRRWASRRCATARMWKSLMRPRPSPSTGRSS